MSNTLTEKREIFKEEFGLSDETLNHLLGLVDNLRLAHNNILKEVADLVIDGSYKLAYNVMASVLIEQSFLTEAGHLCFADLKNIVGGSATEDERADFVHRMGIISTYLKLYDEGQEAEAVRFFTDWIQSRENPEDTLTH